MSFFSVFSKKTLIPPAPAPPATDGPPAPRRPVILTILDGWGFNRRTLGNAIRQGHTPTFNLIMNSYPIALLQASGLAVGLAWGEAGNSEVGHLNLGAGRIVQQYRTRINRSIADGSFFQNPALVGAFDNATKNNSRVHIIGLLTSGSVHADLGHILALLDMALQKNMNNVYLHLFADGKDSGLQEALDLIKKLEVEINEKKIGTIATLMGRNLAMDRDTNWQLVQTAYNALADGKGEPVNDFKEALSASYKKGLTDMKIPAFINSALSYQGIGENDSLIFINFREDSIREIFRSFVEKDFNYFSVRRPIGSYICSMTEYLAGQNQPAAFMPPDVSKSLGQVVSDAGLRQLHIAETIKYAHVTYFFNGLRQDPYEGEDDVLIESVKEIETFPTMRAHEIAARVRAELDKASYDLYIINFANADLLAHTGNYDATIVGVQTIDQAVFNLVEGVLEKNGIMIITADHGNAESLLYSETGAPESKHNDSPVGCYLVANELKIEKTPELIDKETADVNGILGDVAPTILELLGITKPQEMTGQSLVKLLLKSVSATSKK